MTEPPHHYGAADVVVTSGRSSVNEAMLTGESQRIDKTEADPVIAGTTNCGGSLRVEVTGTGERSMLAGIIRLVEQAQRSRSRTQVLADRGGPISSPSCRCRRRPPPPRSSRMRPVGVKGAIYLVEGDRILAAFAVADAVRPESGEAVGRLHRLGLKVVMMTGDARAPADSVARQLGIDTVFAQVLPDQKAVRIEGLRQAGKRVAMVGDYQSTRKLQ